MSFDTSIALVVAFTFVVVAVGAIVWWVNRTPPGYRDAHTDELPLYSVSLGRATTPPRSSGAVPASAAAPDGQRASAPADPAPAARPSPSSTVHTSAQAVAAATVSTAASAGEAAHASSPVPTVTATTATTEHVVVRAAVASSPSAGAPTPSSVGGAAPGPGESNGARAITANGVPGTEIEGQALRFSVPLDGTLQFLPGRLEITGGVDAGREIRFVRVPGPDGSVVTFGRNEGPAYRHVQLREATVSRNHAQMRLTDARWHLTNLSATNPVVVNGRILEAGEEQVLSDGDRIEMGEVVFGFRSR